MEHILYKLSMPNVGSWNGKFTGSGDLYCVVRSYSKKSDIPEKVLSKKSYYYDFGDNWGASVKCSKITSAEKAKYKKESKGFMNYEWMVKEIEDLGRIKTVDERRQENALKNMKVGRE